MPESSTPRRSAPILAALLVALPGVAAAQHAHDAHAGSAVAWLRAGAHAVPLLTHVAPLLRGESRTEAYLTQPTLLGDAAAFGGRLRAHAAVSLEALTIERGELGVGAYGEGYVDRRHPHTYLHELVAAVVGDVGPVAASATLGRGFVPFGSDDPMMRPFVKFPVNHHLAQILERLVAIGGVRTGPLLAEAALFNGNEPLDARDVGSLERFGDSWAARLTVLPLRGVELQASRAWVVSPEMPAGGGWDQRKWSASARYLHEHAAGDVYALLEWKRTTEVDRGTDIFAYGSILAEAALDARGWRPALRLERSERPEEQRLFDPFRTVWPHVGLHGLGLTRWTIAAARIERSAGVGPLGIAPFIEASRSAVKETAGGVFEPEQFYGARRITTLNLGARINIGAHRPRMGRYGVAAEEHP